MKSSLSEPSGNKQLKTSVFVMFPRSSYSLLYTLVPTGFPCFHWNCMYAPFQANRALRVVCILEKLLYNIDF